MGIPHSLLSFKTAGQFLHRNPYQSEATLGFHRPSMALETLKETHLAAIQYPILPVLLGHKGSFIHPMVDTSAFNLLP
jgi:hypothetical protein